MPGKEHPEGIRRLSHCGEVGDERSGMYHPLLRCIYIFRKTLTITTFYSKLLVMKSSSFLKYYQLILEKVSFDEDLLTKEYKKALKAISQPDQLQLHQWMTKKGLMDKVAEREPADISMASWSFIKHETNIAPFLWSGTDYDPGNGVVFYKVPIRKYQLRVVFCLFKRLGVLFCDLNPKISEGLSF